MSAETKADAQDETTAFRPRWGPDGLVPVVAQDEAGGAVLMLAYANEAALRATLSTGQAHYWSRSRGTLWHKGATSGATQAVSAVLCDCDQDALIYLVRAGGGACHTGRPTCFYRRVGADSNDRLNLTFTG